jgi:hypothetical protein
MKIPSKKITWLVVGFLALLGAILIMGQHDYSALAAGRQPTFAWSKVPFADGGSVEYRGLGYSVMRVHRLTGHLVAGEVDTPGMTRFYVGQTLDFWIPLFGRESTRIVLETNR